MLVDGAGYEILDRSECLRLLAGGTEGRVAISVKALPGILPVRFALANERILIRTRIGSTLATATHGAVVAFQTDGREPTSGLVWSVQATGWADHVSVDTDELARVAAGRLPRWASVEADCVVAISTAALAGRRATRAEGHGWV